MSNPSTSPRTARPEGSGWWHNRMAAQHLPWDLVRPSNGLKEHAHTMKGTIRHQVEKSKERKAAEKTLNLRLRSKRGWSGCQSGSGPGYLWRFCWSKWRSCGGQNTTARITGARNRFPCPCCSPKHTAEERQQKILACSAQKAGFVRLGMTSRNTRYQY